LSQFYFYLNKILILKYVSKYDKIKHSPSISLLFFIFFALFYLFFFDFFLKLKTYLPPLSIKVSTSLFQAFFQAFDEVSESGKANLLRRASPDSFTPSTMKNNASQAKLFPP
jgi:hypothetical protein